MNETPTHPANEPDENRKVLILNYSQMIKHFQNGAPATVTPSVFNVIEGNELAEQVAVRAAEIILGRLAESGAIVAYQPERLLRLGEACELLQMSRPTLTKLIRAGQVPTLFDGSKTPRIRLSDLRAFQKSSTKK